MQVFWSVLLERYINEEAVSSLIDIAAHVGERAGRINTPYGRLDQRRQLICEAFRTYGDDPNDCLVMLDNDHAHPVDIINHLVRYPPEWGVIGALAYRRGWPFNPVFFIREEDGKLSFPMAPVADRGVQMVAAVAPCAMMIRRWVLQKLHQATGGKTLWQFVYDDPARAWHGEDMFFAELCEQHGIQQYVDTSIVCPHITNRLISHGDWKPEEVENDERLKLYEHPQPEAAGEAAANSAG